MKAKRRVVTSGGGAPTRRRPTVRKIKPAIVPAVRRIAPIARVAPTTAPGAPSTNGAGRAATAHRPPAAEALPPDREVDLSVDLGRGLRLANPILVA